MEKNILRKEPSVWYRWSILSADQGDEKKEIAYDHIFADNETTARTKLAKQVGAEFAQQAVLKPDPDHQQEPHLSLA